LPPEAMRDGKPVRYMKSLNQVEPRHLISELPHMILESGAYYIDKRLIATGTTDGIIIAADDVDIDLKNMSIMGRPGSTNSSGIVVAGDVRNVSIHDGTIGGWNGWGIDGINMAGCKLRRLEVKGCGKGGVRVGGDSELALCRVADCQGVGIEVGADCFVRDCRSVRNRIVGIMVGGSSSVRECSVHSTQGEGIKCAGSAVVKECVAIDNHINGIAVDTGCCVIGNNCIGNGHGETNGAGIVAIGRGNRIENNNVVGNNIGVRVSGSGNRIQNNHMLDSNIGFKDEGNHNLVVRNSAGGAGIPFETSADSSNGDIVLQPSGNFVVSNSWANFVIGN